MSELHDGRSWWMMVRSGGGVGKASGNNHSAATAAVHAARISQPGQPAGEDTDRRGGRGRACAGRRRARRTPCARASSSRVPHGQRQQGGDGQHQPVPGDAVGVGAARALPLPAQRLERPEAQLDPDAQPIPAHPHSRRGQIGQQQPRLVLACAPDHQQGARRRLARCLKARPAPTQRPARPGHQLARRTAALAQRGQRWHRGGCASTDASHVPGYCATSGDSTSPRSVITSTVIVGGTAGASRSSRRSSGAIQAPLPGPGVTCQATGMAQPR